MKLGFAYLKLRSTTTKIQIYMKLIIIKTVKWREKISLIPQVIMMNMLSTHNSEARKKTYKSIERKKMRKKMSWKQKINTICDVEWRVILGFVVEFWWNWEKNRDLGLDMITDRNPDLGFTAWFDSVHEIKPKHTNFHKESKF